MEIVTSHVSDMQIASFLNISHVYGYGGGEGYGSGDGYGGGDGHGHGYGHGSGRGDAYGHGCGYGYGCGGGDEEGFGYGEGYGEGYEDEYGNGHGSGNEGVSKNIKKYGTCNVYLVDNINTIITNIRGNFARGYILNKDLTLEKCHISKNSNFFAHGKSLKDSVKALEDKILNNLNTDEKIIKFKSLFSKQNFKYQARDFFNWHYLLTGSCETGRLNFCKNHNIDIDNDKFTVNEFIELTENNYNGHIISKLKTN